MEFLCGACRVFTSREIVAVLVMLFGNMAWLVLLSRMSDS